MVCRRLGVLAMLFLVAMAACSKKSSSSSPAAAPAPPPACSPAPPSPPPSAPATAAGTATALAFTSGPLTQNIGICGLCTIQTQEGGGTAAALVNAHTLSLSTSDSSGTFYSDSACSAAISSLALAVGAENGTFYYADAASGSPTLTVTDTFATPLTTATQAETIGTAAPAAPATPASVAPALLAFTNAALAQGASACGALTITLETSASTPVAAAAPLEMLLTSSSTTGNFYSDVNCTQPSLIAVMATGTSAVAAFYKDSTVGSPVLTATPPASTQLTAASQTEAIEGALEFEEPVTGAAHNGCLALTLELPAQTAPATMTLATTSATGAFFIDAQCQTTPITTFNLGTGEAGFTVFYKETSARTNDTITITPPAGLSVAPATDTISFQ